MFSSPSAGSSNFWEVISYISLPSFCLMTLKVIFWPSPPEELRSTACVARVWKAVMFLSMATDCSKAPESVRCLVSGGNQMHRSLLAVKANVIAEECTQPGDIVMGTALWCVCQCGKLLHLRDAPG